MLLYDECATFKRLSRLSLDMVSEKEMYDDLEYLIEKLLWVEFLNNKMAAQLNPLLTISSITIVTMLSLATIIINVAGKGIVDSMFLLGLSIVAIFSLIGFVTIKMLLAKKRLQCLERLQDEVLSDKHISREKIKEKYEKCLLGIESIL